MVADEKKDQQYYLSFLNMNKRSVEDEIWELIEECDSTVLEMKRRIIFLSQNLPAYARSSSKPSRERCCAAR